jgi:hypothetical protein
MSAVQIRELLESKKIPVPKHFKDAQYEKSKNKPESKCCVM